MYMKIGYIKLTSQMNDTVCTVFEMGKLSPVVGVPLARHIIPMSALQ